MTNPTTHTPSAAEKEQQQQQQQQQQQRSHSRSRNDIPSRPTTPLRPPSRTSLRASQTTPNTAGTLVGASAGNEPLNALEPAFAELSDSMADLEANMMHLQLLNESLGRFNENFGAFLYGMNMSAFCVDFPEAPIPQSFTRHKDSILNDLSNSPFRERAAVASAGGAPMAPEITDATFLTSDTTFVENPPTSSKPSSKYGTVTPSTASRSHRQTVAPVASSARGGGGGAGLSARGRGARGGSGIARGTNSRGSRAGASGIARGIPRGRGARS